MSRFSARARVLAVATSTALVMSGFAVVSAPAQSATPQAGGILTMLEHEPRLDHLDPTRIYTGRDLAFMNAFHTRTLVAYNPVPGEAGAGIVPDLATNTGVPSNQAKVWKFTLRPGTKFEDGTAITCEHVRYGVSRVFAQDVLPGGPTYLITWLDIPTDADGNSIYTGPYKNTPAGVKAFNKAVACSPDNRTITFTLNKSVADFNYLGTYGVISPVQKKNDTGDKYDLKPQATGPYKIVQNDKTQLRMVRNKYWSKSTDVFRTPYPDNIVVRFGLAEDVRDQIMLEDQIPNTVSLDSLQPANTRTFFADPTKKNQRMNVFDPYVRYAAMNVSKGHMDCLAIRKAVFFAINTQALIDLSGGTVYYGVPGDNPVKPVLGLDYAPTKGNIHDPNWKITGNPDYAKSLVEGAKASCPDAYKKATADGIVWDIAQSATNQKASQLITTALNAAGIQIKFNFIPSGQYYSTVMNPAKQNDISSAGWGADWANASTVLPELFTQEGGFNLSQNWNDPAYAAFKKLSDAGKNETNRAKQAAIWKQASQYVMDQYWIIRPIFGKGQFQWGSKVGGVYYWEPQGTFLFGSLYVKG